MSRCDWRPAAARTRRMSQIRLKRYAMQLSDTGRNLSKQAKFDIVNSKICNRLWSCDTSTIIPYSWVSFAARIRLQTATTRAYRPRKGPNRVQSTEPDRGYFCLLYFTLETAAWVQQVLKKSHVCESHGRSCSQNCAFSPNLATLIPLRQPLHPQNATEVPREHTEEVRGKIDMVSSKILN